MKRKLFTLFLSLAIVMTFMPAMSFAQDLEPLPQGITIEKFDTETSQWIPATLGEDCYYVPGTSSLVIAASNLRVTGSYNGNLKIDVTEFPVTFKDFTLISSAQPCLGVRPAPNTDAVLLFEGSNTFSAVENMIDMPRANVVLQGSSDGTSSLQLISEGTDYPPVCCKGLSVQDLNLYVSSNYASGAVTLSSNSQITLGEYDSIFGAAGAKASDVTQNIFSNYDELNNITFYTVDTVDGSPAKTIKVVNSKGNDNPPEKDSRKQTILKIAAAAVAVTAVAVTVANVSRAIAHNKAVFNTQAAKAQQAKQAYQFTSGVRTALSGATVVVALTQFVHSLGNLFGFR